VHDILNEGNVEESDGSKKDASDEEPDHIIKATRPEFIMLGHEGTNYSTAVPMKVIILRDDHRKNIKDWGRIFYALGFMDQVNTSAKPIPCPLLHAQKLLKRIMCLSKLKFAELETKSTITRNNKQHAYDEVNKAIKKHTTNLPNNAWL